jgi:polysaccharide export outer membrane protein
VDLTDASDYLKRNIQIFPGDLVVVPSKKYKEFDKRISTIIPLASTTTAVAILLGAVL